MWVEEDAKPAEKKVEIVQRVNKTAEKKDERQVFEPRKKQNAKCNFDVTKCEKEEQILLLRL